VKQLNFPITQYKHHLQTGVQQAAKKDAQE
jgi:hypothetical protein